MYTRERVFLNMTEGCLIGAGCDHQKRLLHHFLSLRNQSVVCQDGISLKTRGLDYLYRCVEIIQHLGSTVKSTYLDWWPSALSPWSALFSTRVLLLSVLSWLQEPRSFKDKLCKIYQTYVYWMYPEEGPPPGKVKTILGPRLTQRV